MSESEDKPFFTNEDGTVKVVAMSEMMGTDDDKAAFQEIVRGMNSYKWRDEDFLISVYPKNGTHLVWEIMNMLIRDSAAYIKESKIVCMLDFCPVAKAELAFPSPRILNTHYRVDVLPKEFRKAKTVVVLRNPKDVAVSYYFHFKNMMDNMIQGHEMGKAFNRMTITDYITGLMWSKDQPFGSHFDFIEYVWSLKNNPNYLIVFFEDVKLNPVETIQKLDEFMGTRRTPELVQQIADAMNIDKMRTGKAASMDDLGERFGVFKGAVKGVAADFFRKGEIGNWKTHFSVKDNEMFDALYNEWSVGKDVPSFTYDC